MPAQPFVEKLNEQIANEFAASQQYVGAAVYYDAETLPRLAAFFYRQALEERFRERSARFRKGRSAKFHAARQRHAIPRRRAAAVILFPNSQPGKVRLLPAITEGEAMSRAPCQE